MPDDMRARYDYALATDWTGAISVLGGTAQIGTGILACSSLVGCAGGAYLGAHGLNNIYEGFTGETGLLREGYRAIFGEDWGDIAYGAADVGTSVHGATKLVLKPDAWKLFRHIPSDYVNTPVQIKRIRTRNKASQGVFAVYLNTSKSTVQKWEQGQKKPNGPSLKLLNLVAEKGLEVLA